MLSKGNKSSIWFLICLISIFPAISEYPNICGFRNERDSMQENIIRGRKEWFWLVNWKIPLYRWHLNWELQADWESACVLCMCVGEQRCALDQEEHLKTSEVSPSLDGEKRTRWSWRNKQVYTYIVIHNTPAWHCRWILYQLNHQGGPRILQWGSLSLLQEIFPIQVDSLLTKLSGKPLYL